MPLASPGVGGPARGEGVLLLGGLGRVKGFRVSGSG